MKSRTNDIHIRAAKALISPAVLQDDLPLGDEQAKRIQAWRQQVTRIITGKDKRLMVIVGPCSIHDPLAALDYASRLHKLASRLEDDLLIIMRVYFEKPRTTVGWKGMINDPGLDGSFRINDGLRLARKGGVVLVAHALWRGRVADPAQRDDTVANFRLLLKEIAASDAVLSVLSDSGDGLLQLVKLTD